MNNQYSRSGSVFFSRMPFACFVFIIQFTFSVHAEEIFTGTKNVLIEANLDASSAIVQEALIPNAPAPNTATPENVVTFGDLNSFAEFSTVIDVIDPLLKKHTLTVFFFHIANHHWRASIYANSSDADIIPSSSSDSPRILGSIGLFFGPDGLPLNQELHKSFIYPIWSSTTKDQAIEFDLGNFTQYAAPSSVYRISVTPEELPFNSQTIPSTPHAYNVSGSLTVYVDNIVGDSESYEIVIEKAWDRRAIRVPGPWATFLKLPRGNWKVKYRLVAPTATSELKSKYSKQVSALVTR
jgi:hypothetical protein